MATGGVEKTRTVGNSVHKNKDKTGFTMLTFSECLCAFVCRACEFVHVCACACLSVYGWLFLHAYIDMLVTD